MKPHPCAARSLIFCPSILLAISAAVRQISPKSSHITAVPGGLAKWYHSEVVLCRFFIYRYTNVYNFENGWNIQIRRKDTIGKRKISRIFHASSFKLENWKKLKFWNTDDKAVLNITSCTVRSFVVVSSMTYVPVSDEWIHWNSIVMPVLHYSHKYRPHLHNRA